MNENTTLEKYSSADLIVCPKQGRVNIGGQVVRLGPVNMRVLVVLLENQSQVVSRSMLLDSVWKNQIISDDTLTRCISDIRVQLGKFSKQDKLIETIPKCGYRWIPKVNQTIDDSDVAEIKKVPFYYWLLIGLLGMLVLSSSFLWVVNKLYASDKVSIALMPIQVMSAHIDAANNLEEILRDKILTTKKLRFLSETALDNNRGNSFNYLYNEFGAKWMIEGRIRDYKNQIKATLNLVDMRTALVVYSSTQGIGNEQKELKIFCDEFIKNVLRIVD